ncbi:MAG TPA: ASCH domain-containing protein [Ornithinimicrobium sp.]|uniref:ASCH domain-containing protein n=1 Tax=Ornithinimicrobium sp. TaxID=1977084 RepID=UPI002B483F7C|nr:ASCH domain-containing protein [Ornithinimicrobium sp.]HKJ12811.1 ASCH domain-containing protein [Ornithinimicrobium sp.]
MNQGEIDAFWRDAQIRGRLNPAGAYLGRNIAETLPPPAWSFSHTPEEADHLLALVLSGVKTATSSRRSDYDTDDESLPEPGALSILLDGRGHPRALIRTTAVSVVPFEDVDEGHAEAEGEGSRTLSAWRSAHRTFFHPGRPDDPFDPRMLVVLERFTVLVARPPATESSPVPVE